MTPTPDICQRHHGGNAESVKRIEVFSTGGGTQSTAIAALIIQGKLPKPDLVVIADTGREMPTTWQYLDAVVRPALKAIGLEVHRVKTSEWARERVREIFTADQIQIPAFSNLNGAKSKLSAFCSSHWKRESIDRWMSQTQGLTRSKYKKWIGFSLDETNRVLRMQGGKDYKSGLIRFPLVYDVPTKRQAAIRLVEEMGWPKPPRSRCWMCPNQSDYEWAEVQTDHPDLFAEAIALDESIRERDPNAFLHSTIKPLRDADLTKPDDLFSASCPSGECFL
jgi:hypothetical protein